MSLPAMSQVSSKGTAMPISFVRLCSSPPATGRAPTFLGVAAFRPMPDHAHDVGLTPVRVEGVLHRLAIHGQRIVRGAPGPIPRIERPVQRPRFNPYRAIPNHKLAGNHIAAVLGPAAKTFAGFLPQGIGPIPRWLYSRACRTASRPPRCPARPTRDGAVPESGADREWS